MDINVDFNVNFPGNQLPALHKKEAEAVAPDAENFLKETKRPKIEKSMVMELKDVQNFLYMLIGADLKVTDEGEISGNILNLSA
ncbi:MAG: hypothetical protein FWG92_00715 [Leptospirales bacterium]|nr:hypothetical protein [Leptospirales bacterium]